MPTTLSFPADRGRQAACRLILVKLYTIPTLNSFLQHLKNRHCFPCLSPVNHNQGFSTYQASCAQMDVIPKPHTSWLRAESLLQWGSKYRFLIESHVWALLRSQFKGSSNALFWGFCFCCTTSECGCSAPWHRVAVIHTHPTATGSLCQLLKEKGKKEAHWRGQFCLHSLPACRSLRNRCQKYYCTSKWRNHRRFTLPLAEIEL